MRDSKMTAAALVWKFYIVSAPRMLDMGVGRTWMIWSSFLIDSADGPPAAGAAGSSRGEGAGSRLEAPEPARARPVRPSSLGLFVRDGFVWGDEAGDETRGDGRAC